MDSTSMHTSSYDTTWAIYCAQLVRVNDALKLLEEILRIFADSELVQENALSVLWHLTYFGFKYVRDMKACKIPQCIKTAMQGFPHNKLINERGKALFIWFSETNRPVG